MKRRLVIGYEGKMDESNNVFFDVDSVMMIDAQVPIGPLNAFDMWRYGWARDLQRDAETGALSVEIDIPEVSEENADEFVKLYAPSYYITDLNKIVDDHGVTHLTSGRLRGITMVPLASWPMPIPYIMKGT